MLVLILARISLSDYYITLVLWLEKVMEGGNAMDWPLLILVFLIRGFLH